MRRTIIRYNAKLIERASEISFLRFTDMDVLQRIDQVVDVNERWIDENKWSIIGVEER